MLRFSKIISEAEVPDADDPDTQLNQALIEQLDRADVLLIAHVLQATCPRPSHVPGTATGVAPTAGQAHSARGTEPVEAIVLDLRLQRAIRILAPVRNQFVERDRIDHGTRQNMRADFGTLLDHDDVEVGVELLEPDRSRQAGRPGADDHDVEFHGLTRR